MNRTIDITFNSMANHVLSKLTRGGSRICLNRGSAKDLCNAAHIVSTKSLTAGLQGPVKSPGSSRNLHVDAL